MNIVRGNKTVVSIEAITDIAISMPLISECLCHTR